MKSGVYAIVNLANGKRYIGSAKNLEKRWTNYHRCYLRAGNHQRKLQHAWNKYGEAAFSYQPLLICAPKDLLFYEQRAIDAYQWNDLYNICKTAGSRFGIKHSEETRRKLSVARIGNKYGAGNKNCVGFKHTEDSRRKKAESIRLYWASLSDEERMSRLKHLKQYNTDAGVRATKEIAHG